MTIGADNLDMAIQSRLLPPLARRLLRLDASASCAIGTRGAVLFCDLSGFSRMGAEAIARSERGAEDLRAEINAVFDRVSRSIAGQGGYLLYYAGDAVAACWTDAGNPALAIRAAVAAGRAVQAEVTTMGAGLSMRAGVTHGELWLLDLAPASGGRLPVFCGPALDALDELEPRADGVTLDPAARAVAGG